MWNAKALANASAIVSEIIYFICVVLAIIAPQFLFNFAMLTTHGLNLEPLRLAAPRVDMGSIIMGAVLVGVSTWLTLYTVAYFYNKLQK